jgi:hypothetical protein
MLLGDTRHRRGKPLLSVFSNKQSKQLAFSQICNWDDLVAKHQVLKLEVAFSSIPIIPD